MQYLEVQNENPVILHASIDAAGALQLVHADGLLSDYSQTLHATHERDASITVELHDADGWLLNASHGSSSWTRGTALASYVFRESMTDPVTVNVIATNGSQTKTRTIYVKTKPKGSLPIG